MRLSHTFAILILCCAGGNAWAGKTASAPAPKVSAPARTAAPAAKTASGGTARGGGATTTTKGPTTSSPNAGRGPTTSSPGGGRGPTTASPNAGRGATTSSPTTANGGRGAGPAAAGGKATAPAAAGRAGTAAPGGRGPASASAISHPAPAGSHSVHTADGKEVRTRPNGQRSDVHDAKRGMDVHHGLNGDRRVSVERADHSRVVAERGGRGYVQHPYAFRGHEFGHRTYYYRGRAYDRFYRRYDYRGVYLDVYAPAYYYPAGLYGWAYNPWATPVVFGWGWGVNPWYAGYGFYFAPAPVYPTPSLWLTDYMIANQLQAAYQDGPPPQPGAQPGSDPMLTPDVKNLISAEVQRQLALENAEAQTTAQHQDPDPGSSGVARMLADGQTHVFVAGQSLDVVDSTGRECPLSQGDVLQLRTPPAPAETSAALIVLASKGGSECGKASTVSVTVADLQNMQNSMRETIDQGLGELQKDQGKGGLPVAPQSARVMPVKTEFALAAPPPEADAATQIAQQSKEADLAEKEIGTAVTDAPAGGPSADAPATPPPTLTTGQTVEQVTAMMGQPKSVVDLGARKIYVYPDMKITFTAGKVSNIQ